MAPIHISASNGQTQLVKTDLDRGTAVDVQDEVHPLPHPFVHEIVGEWACA
jgi:hypothetical protein